MAQARHLRNAPITEALVDFRVSRATSPITEASLEVLRASLQDSYPIMERQSMAQFEIKGGTPQSNPEARFRGFMFKSSDRLRIVQFRIDGFTYNRLKPYPSWEEILPEAIRLWRIYVATAGPEAINRAAVRYINRLQLPAPTTGLSEYLEAPPQTPEGYQASLKDFLTRVTLSASHGLSAVVTTASQPSLGSSDVTIILDIDVFSDAAELAPDDARLQPMLERLRVLKNRLFFESLTEVAVRVFE
jgi:uncharacterized protein (TIGR04255 family)